MSCHLTCIHLSYELSAHLPRKRDTSMSRNSTHWQSLVRQRCAKGTNYLRYICATHMYSVAWMVSHWNMLVTHDMRDNVLSLSKFPRWNDVASSDIQWQAIVAHTLPISHVTGTKMIWCLRLVFSLSTYIKHGFVCCISWVRFKCISKLVSCRDNLSSRR